MEGISIPIAGAILLLARTVFLNKKMTVFKSWKLLLSGSIFLAAAVFLWYDSVTRVGASKEGLLAGPLETVVVLTLKSPKGKVAKNAAYRCYHRPIRILSNCLK